MAAAEEIIVFDNLVRPTNDLVGDYRAISAKAPEPFVASNAPGMPADIGEDLASVGKIASHSARVFREVFSA